MNECIRNMYVHVLTDLQVSTSIQLPRTCIHYKVTEKPRNLDMKSADSILQRVKCPRVRVQLLPRHVVHCALLPASRPSEDDLR